MVGYSISQVEFDAWVNNMLRIRITKHIQKNGQEDDGLGTWTVLANQIKTTQVAMALGENQKLMPENTFRRIKEGFPQEIEFLNKIDEWNRQGKNPLLIQQLGKQWHDNNPVK